MEQSCETVANSVSVVTFKPHVVAVAAVVVVVVVVVVSSGIVTGTATATGLGPVPSLVVGVVVGASDVVTCAVTLSCREAVMILRRCVGIISMCCL